MMNSLREYFVLPVPSGSIRCFLRRSPRARALRIRILPGGEVEAVLPPGLSEADARAFAVRQTGWILRMLRRMSLHSAAAAEKKNMLFPCVLPLEWFGGDFRVEYEFLPVRWTAAKCETEARLVRIRGSVLDPDTIPAAVGDMLRINAEKFLFPRLGELASAFGFSPGKLSARIQKGRWGSCSARGGAVSLNALLLLLPRRIADYVLIHELCHLRHMNHSEAFWREVGKYCPDFAERRAALKKSEKNLTGFLRKIR